MNKGVEVITIKIDSNLLRQAEEAFSRYGLTVEQAVLLFFRWCVDNPAVAAQELRRWQSESEAQNG